jgi:hypothetical protein
LRFTSSGRRKENHTRNECSDNARSFISRKAARAASVSDGVWMYQLTEKGLAVEITATSTKYYKDDDLN